MDGEIMPNPEHATEEQPVVEGRCPEPGCGEELGSTGFCSNCNEFYEPIPNFIGYRRFYDINKIYPAAVAQSPNVEQLTVTPDHEAKAEWLVETWYQSGGDATNRYDRNQLKEKFAAALAEASHSAGEGEG